MSRNSKLISENLRTEIAKELGVYDQVKKDGGSWENVSSKPPNSSALDLYRAPNTLPILTPIAERTKVTMPIKLTAGTMLTFSQGFLYLIEAFFSRNT